MKTQAALVLFVLATSPLFSHDHIEVGIDPDHPNANQLSLYGPDYQLALLVPVGEPFSSYAPDFPGGYYANELTFTSENTVLEPADGADPIFEILSVTGPEGGIFSFWEVGQTSPAWSLPSGWTSASSTVPALIPVWLGGENHVHGRVLTSNKAGNFSITYRAYDGNGIYEASSPKTLTFQVLDPPPLQISAHNGNVLISFQSRNLLSYDLQSSTTLASDSWATVEGLEPISGDGTVLNIQDPLNGRPKVFYRLVEYR
jgi:hypothetical protein